MSFYPDGQPKIPNQTPIPSVPSVMQVAGATDGALPQDRPVTSAQARARRRSLGLLRIAGVELVVLAAMVVAVFVLEVVPVEVGIWFIVAAAVVGGMTLSTFLMRSMQADRAEILAENEAAAAAHRAGSATGTGTGVGVSDAPVSVQDARVPGASFELPVEDVFSITGRGTVVTGRVSVGEIRVGRVVAVVREGRIVANAKIGGIEAFRDVKPTAAVGESVGLVLDGVTRSDVERGDIIAG